MPEYAVDGLRIPDRYEIEQLMYRYAKAADQADIETQLTVFQDDCRSSTMSPPVQTTSWVNIFASSWLGTKCTSWR